MDTCLVNLEKKFEQRPSDFFDLAVRWRRFENIQRAFDLFRSLFSLLPEQIVFYLWQMTGIDFAFPVYSSKYRQYIIVNNVRWHSEPARLGRNEMCFCHRGKKYKNCCGPFFMAEERRQMLSFYLKPKYYRGTNIPKLNH